MSYTFDFDVVISHWSSFLRGLMLTLQLSVISMLVAMVFGLLLVLAKGSRFQLLSGAASGFIEIIRNTPFLIQIFFVFFGLPQLGIRPTPYAAAVAALGLNGAAYCAEIIRGGVQAIKRGQVDAGLALEMSRLQVFRFVVLRPALRSVYPALTSQFILIMLTSSVASTISTLELTLVGLQLESLTFRSFEIFFSIGAIYLATSLVLSAIFSGIGRIYFSYPVK